MFDHVTTRVSDRAASRSFYELALGAPKWEGAFVMCDGFPITEGNSVMRRPEAA